MFSTPMYLSLFSSLKPSFKPYFSPQRSIRLYCGNFSKSAKVIIFTTATSPFISAFAKYSKLSYIFFWCMSSDMISLSIFLVLDKYANACLACEFSCGTISSLGLGGSSASFSIGFLLPSYSSPQRYKTAFTKSIPSTFER